MALKDDILKALENNLTHRQVIDDKVKTVKPPTEEGSKLDTLSKELAKAIRDYIDSLTFRIESSTAETILPPGSVITAAGGPNTNPIKVSTTISKDNPKGITDAPNSLQSVVKVDKNDNKDKSGIA